jgi:hypothetical protein
MFALTSEDGNAELCRLFFIVVEVILSLASTERQIIVCYFALLPTWNCRAERRWRSMEFVERSARIASDRTVDAADA